MLASQFLARAGLAHPLTSASAFWQIAHGTLNDTLILHGGLEAMRLCTLAMNVALATLAWHVDTDHATMNLCRQQTASSMRTWLFDIFTIAPIWLMFSEHATHF